MKTRQLYQSNYIFLQLYLCIPFKKGYISNQEYTIFSEIDAEISESRSYFIVLLFQGYHFHQIQPTCRFSSNYRRRFMLASIFILRCIAEIQC